MTTFKHDTTFPQHMKAHEDKIDINAPMLCPVCSVELESRKLLNPHIKEHHPEKGGCCIECEEFMSVSKTVLFGLWVQVGSGLSQGWVQVGSSSGMGNLIFL